MFIQALFFALLIITFLGGFIAYYTPSQKTVDPMKMMMDSTGYDSEETLNHKKSQQINMKTSNGVIKIRKQMNDIALEQSELLDMIRDQQQILKNTSKDASDILLDAKKEGDKNNKDILQLEALTSQIQDQQRLSVDRGNELIVLNNQLTKNRQAVSEEMDLANINTDSTLSSLQEHNFSLNNQATEFFGKVTEHNMEVQDQMDKIQLKMQDMANKATRIIHKQNTKERMQRMMDKQREDMIRLADSQERSRTLLRDAEQNLADARERLNDSLQRSKDLMEEEHQKQLDQQDIVQQSIADQKQRIQDQRDLQNH